MEFQVTKHLSNAFNHTFQLAVLTAGICMCCELSAHTNPRSYDIAEAIDEKTTPQLKHAFDEQRFAFLALFNRISETAQTDMVCQYHKPIGSQVGRKSCEPRYVKDFRSMLEQTPSQHGIDMSRLPTNEHVRLLTQDEREEVFEHVSALIATHPELYQSFSKLDAIHQRMQQEAVSQTN